MGVSLCGPQQGNRIRSGREVGVRDAKLHGTLSVDSKCNEYVTFTSQLSIQTVDFAV